MGFVTMGITTVGATGMVATVVNGTTISVTASNVSAWTAIFSRLQPTIVGRQVEPRTSASISSMWLMATVMTATTWEIVDGTVAIVVACLCKTTFVPSVSAGTALSKPPLETNALIRLLRPVPRPNFTAMVCVTTITTWPGATGTVAIVAPKMARHTNTAPTVCVRTVRTPCLAL